MGAALGAFTKIKNVTFQIIKDFPDYHPEHPGAKPGGGRSLECPLFPFVELGSWRERVTVGPQLSGNITMKAPSSGPAGAATPPGRGMRAGMGRRRE